MRRRIRAAALPIHRHSLAHVFVDGALVALAYYLAFQLRFNNGPTEPYLALRNRTFPWVVIGGILVLIATRVYQRRWRYSSQRDYVVLARGVLMMTVLTVVGVAVLHPVLAIREHGKLAAIGLPNGVTVLFLLLSLAFLLSARVLARTLHERRPFAGFPAGRPGARNVLIVGAGDGGRLVLREILRNRSLGLLPVGFLDDDPRKRGLRIDGVKVRGDTKADLGRILDEAEPDEVIIAIPSAPGSTRARVVRECRARGVAVRTLPTVFELLQHRGPGAIAQQVREVRVQDVLGREPVHVELRAAGAYLAGGIVVVTGAGGSIGSELCRQIAQVNPAKLLLVDHAEDNLFEITREMEEERHVSSSVLVPVLADCKSVERLAEIFQTHRPDVVFHAAAYKHVGLMQGNPIEAVRNNAIATRRVAMLAGRTGVERFVLVSTDKAVQPATVMGASKALAELALEAASAAHPKTSYAAVRFGNVLGSSGSVVPIFARQIERGGPVTVTDERMTRYFMTIPEAVHLVIRAGALVAADRVRAPLSRGGAHEPLSAASVGAPASAASVGASLTGGSAAARPELFVLDMGEPVSILELARAMIELSGLRLGRDIEIEIIGARPGEKLSESLFAEHESLIPTEAEKVMRIQRPPVDAEVVESVFATLTELLDDRDADALAAALGDLAAAPWVQPHETVQERPRASRWTGGRRERTTVGSRDGTAIVGGGSEPPAVRLRPS